MSPEMRRAKLAKLVEVEGFDDESELFAAAISDSVCPAICCNPANPERDYTAEMEPDQDRGWCEACERGPSSRLSCSGGSSDRRAMSTADIRALNDAFRTTLTGGKVLMTAGVDALPSDVKAMVIRRVATFSDFTGERPTRRARLRKLLSRRPKVLFQDRLLRFEHGVRIGRPDDPSKTTRVLTIMLVAEY